MKQVNVIPAEAGKRIAIEMELKIVDTMLPGKLSTRRIRLFHPLTGRKDYKLESVSDACICVPGKRFVDRVQELHIKIIHIFIEMVERHFHPELYN